MDGSLNRRQRRRGAGRGGCGRAADASGAGSGSSLTGRTTVRVLVAAGTYLGQDLRDPDGFARPLLRRAALRLAVRRSLALRRIGEAYLRADPPALDELPAGQVPVALIEAAPGPGRFAAPGQS